MRISEWALKHTVPVIVITAGAVLAGLLSYTTLNREFIPVITEPAAIVVTLWPGVAAEKVEGELTSVLENYFSGIAGLEDMRSNSQEGVSIIKLRFDEDLNIDFMVQEVRTQVDQSSRELPDGLLGKPVVTAAGSRGLPVVVFSVSGEMEADALYNYVNEKVLTEIYKVDGVAQVNVLGGLQKVLEIKLDTLAMRETGISIPEVYGALRRRNITVPTGLVEWQGKEWAFRVSGQFSEISEIGDLLVGYSDGVPVFLNDLAVTGEVYADADERIRSSKKDLLVVQISKRVDGHTIQMSQDIQERLSDFDGLEFVMLHDDAEIVSTSLRAVIRSALTGIGMAIIVIWLFLRNWPYTSVIAVSLPVSLVLTLVCMKLAGMSINLLTLAGITVSLGMVVDAAIVVLENIHRRSDAGDNPDTAVFTGVTGVTSAVIAFVTTSICVFLPLLFLKGIIGSVLKDISLTLIFTLSTSLFAALFVVPPLARRSLNKLQDKEVPVNRILVKLESFYRRGIQRSIRYRGVVVAAASAILIASVFAADSMGITFIPAADYNELYVSIKLASGSSLTDSVQAADWAEEVIRREISGVSDIVFYVGMKDDLSGDARTREALWGHIILKNAEDRTEGFRQIIDRLNEVLPPALPDMQVAVLNGGFDRLVFLGTNGPGYRVELSSDSHADIIQAARQIRDFFDNDSEIVNTESDIEQDRYFVLARLDSEILDSQGIDAAHAGLTSRIAFSGTDIGLFQPDSGLDRRIILNTDLKNSQPDNETTERLWIRNNTGQLVSLNYISEIHEKMGVSSIFRHNRKRTVTVIGYGKGDNIRGITQRLRESIVKNPLPSTVEWRIDGVGGLVTESINRLALVLIISLLLVYGVMAILFERFIQPLIIMGIVPFCFIGVVGGLMAFGSDISLVSFLGIVALGGIVVNNSIVQVDRFNQLRKKGFSLDDAIVEGAASRLRPILMTTLTTFFGVLPLAFSQGSAARLYAPLGQVIAGGLASSTLVTLFLTPVLYRLVESKKNLRNEIP